MSHNDENRDPFAPQERFVVPAQPQSAVEPPSPYQAGFPGPGAGQQVEPAGTDRFRRQQPPAISPGGAVNPAQPTPPGSPMPMVVPPMAGSRSPGQPPTQSPSHMSAGAMPGGGSHQPDGAPTMPGGTGPVSSGSSQQKGVSRKVLAAVVALSLVLGAGAGFGASFLAPGPDIESLLADQDETVQASIEAIAETSVPKVVMIEFFSNAGSGSGSGFFFRPDGYILTNYHVVSYMVESEEFEFNVVLSDGTKYTPRLIGGSPSYDVAVLKIDMEDSPHFSLADSSKVKVGQSVIAVGAPLGLQSTVTTGIISAKDRPAVTQGDGYIGFYSAFQTDTAINSGNSGGPLLDMDGKVLGINSAARTPEGSTGQIGLNFAIQSNQVSRLAGEIIGSSEGDATFPYLGAQLDIRYRGQGAKIASGSDSITSGSPAERAGLEAGDVVVKMNGVPVSDVTQLIALVRGLTPLDKLTLTVKRNGSDKEEEVTVTSGSQPTSQDKTISSEFIV